MSAVKYVYLTNYVEIIIESVSSLVNISADDQAKATYSV